MLGLQMAATTSSFCVGSGDQTWVIRLVWPSAFYPPSHLAGPSWDFVLIFSYYIFVYLGGGVSKGWACMCHPALLVLEDTLWQAGPSQVVGSRD